MLAVDIAGMTPEAKLQVAAAKMSAPKRLADLRAILGLDDDG